jgi:hypothetical protein
MKPLFRDPLSFLDYEIAGEKASALGRLGRRLEAGLASLRSFDAEHDVGNRGKASLALDALAQRKALVAEAGEAYWCFVIQRECCGMRDSTAVIRAYGVPREVVNRAGPKVSAD